MAVAQHSDAPFNVQEKARRTWRGNGGQIKTAGPAISPMMDYRNPGRRTIATEFHETAQTRNAPGEKRKKRLTQLRIGPPLSI
jgi:hypothetical protein